jgi:hypothetical protein
MERWLERHASAMQYAPDAKSASAQEGAKVDPAPRHKHSSRLRWALGILWSLLLLVAGAFIQPVAVKLVPGPNVDASVVENQELPSARCR